MNVCAVPDGLRHAAAGHPRGWRGVPPYGRVMSRTVVRSARVDAPPSAVFDLLSDPQGHVEMDGSGSVRGVARAPERLGPGDVFWMSMRLGLPYVVWNRVVEHEQDRLIAWTHLPGHRWRYELEPVDDGAATRLTATYDYGAAGPVAPVLGLLRFPELAKKGLTGTLEAVQRLAPQRA